YHKSLPAEDEWLTFRSQLAARLRAMLGAIASEHVFYGENTTGVTGDLIQATGVATTMVGIVGMGADRLDPAMSSRAANIGERLIRLFAAALGALLLTLPAQSVRAQDPFSPVSPRHEAARLMSAELAITTALAQRQQLLAAPAPSSLMERVRFDMALAAVEFNYRTAIRQEEVRVYELASYA